jgi:hypothetical protein
MRRRAFTILELLIGLVASAVVLTAMIAAFAEVMKTQRQQRVRAELARQGAFLGHVLNTELRVIGLGRPEGNSVIGNKPPPISVLFAGPTAIGFVADLPRPDATSNTFGFLEDRPAGFQRVMWHTDNNGVCAPDGGACDIRRTSTLYRGDVATCATNAADRTCPWSNHRLRPGETFQLVAGNGTWTNLIADGAGNTSAGLTMEAALAPDGGNVRGLVVGPATNDVGQALGWPAAWLNTARGDAPVDVRGQGFVTTLDRVFFRHCAAACPGGTGRERVLERRQCWGPLHPDHPAWPHVDADTDDATLRSGAFDPLAVPGTTCTPWEVAARDVETFRLSYFRARSGGSPGSGAFELDAAARRRPRRISGTAFGRADITQIRFELQLAREVYDSIVRHDVVGTVRLRNR